MPSNTSRILVVATFVAAMSWCGPGTAEEPDPARRLIAQLDTGAIGARRKAVYEIWKALPGMKGTGPALARAVASMDEYLRSTAVKAIWKIEAIPQEARTVVPGLLEALKSSHAPVRTDAASLLFRLRLFAADGADDLVRALDDTDPGVRANAAAALGVAGWKRLKVVVPALAKRLADPDKDVRKWSAKALATLDPGAIVDPLKARLGSDDAEVRADAAFLVGHSFGFGRSVLPLLVKAVSDPDEKVRAAAASAIGAISPEAGAQALVSVLADESAIVRLNAMRSLETSAALDAKTRSALVRVTTAEEDPMLRRMAAQVLASFPEVEDSVFLALLEDPDPTVWGHAAGALQLRRCRAAVGPLVKALGHEDASRRGRACAALGGIGEGAIAALDPVLGLLDDEDRSVQAAALRSAAQIAPGSGRVLQILLERLEGEDRSVALAALPLLGVRARPAVPALGKILRTAEDYQRQYAIQALREIGPAARGARSTLAEVMRENGMVRLFAAAALVGLDGNLTKEAMGVLVAALDDPAARSPAIYQLRSIGPAAVGALPALGQVLEDETDPYRAHVVAAAIAVIGGPEGGKKGYDRLLASLAIPDPFDPAAEDAAIHLGNLGPSAEGAVPTLLRALDSVNPMRRAGAAEALGRIGPAARPALPRLLELEPLESPNIRRTIRISLALIRTGK